MTKRDVAIWFCKVFAIIGMLDYGFGLFRFIQFYSSYGFGAFQLFNGLPSFLLSLVLLIFARGVGTELAAEGEHGTPISSAEELKILVWRCIGLSLFLNGAPTATMALFGIATSLLVSGAAFFSSTNSILTNMLLGAAAALVQSLLGFYLAFAPRIRMMFSGR